MRIAMTLGAAALALTSCNAGEVDDPAGENCATCIDMVEIPGGTFLIGSPDDERGREGVPDSQGALETPQVEISVPAFALGKTEVTVDQYAAFVEATGHPSQECQAFVKTEQFTGWLPAHGTSWREALFKQDGDHPVTCVSWDDAKAYADWLAEETGEPYRLPTEAEWEYAARAGTTTARYWGDSDGPEACEYGNVAGASSFRPQFDCDDGYAFTAPASYGKPNAFGLYGMLGNQGEWTADCGTSNYADEIPRDGSAYAVADCELYIGRGGSWWNDRYYIRAARRYAANGPYYIMGIRVAKDAD
ncbi:formylglycine-generating enzyme family protein [Altererythrobacter sp. MF3-039]|uniref:formylglycine-generating enzyme family protein n=1 Tax=Altererythrobacter sp. MF3-039 TaxID=3252901 RepID=UPI00390C92C7